MFFVSLLRAYWSPSAIVVQSTATKTRSTKPAQHSTGGILADAGLLINSELPFTWTTPQRCVGATMCWRKANCVHSHTRQKKYFILQTNRSNCVCLSSATVCLFVRLYVCLLTLSTNTQTQFIGRRTKTEIVPISTGLWFYPLVIIGCLENK